MSEERREFSPMSLSELNEVLGLTVKEDNLNKVITFLCCLSAYTENSQFNISFNAPSSSGKSYIPLEVASYFPKEDVKEIGYCTAQAFYHDAELIDKEKGIFAVDFERKIVIFIDQPYPDVLHRLRPILSHDKKIIEAKITDKSQKHGLKTKNIFVKGFASVIFCSAGLKVDEQEGTRFILLSPETTQEKIRKGVLEALKKESNPTAHCKELAENVDRRNLIERIRAIKEAKITEIRIHDIALIARWFIDEQRIPKPRHQRDAKRVCSIIKSHALLNLWNREMLEPGVILTDDEDIEVGLKLWEEIAECQELNLPPYIYKI